MKYILIASLLTSAAYAAPFAQVQGSNANTGATNAGQQTQQQQGVQQPGVQTGSQTGTQTGATQNAPQTGTGAGIANGQTPSAADLATAVSNWQADTSMVSNFLNTGKGIQNNIQFKQAATVAFNAEVDELNHKAIIDAANSGDPNVIAANSTLATGGSFQDVVNKLQEMSVKGQAAVGNIDLINQNRCVNVLPNIDAYMASTGSASQAIRPTVCDQTGVAGGVQGTGRTQPGQPAGSPAAAFAAAQSLAAGTGNGLVQNGATLGTATPAGTVPVNGQQPAAGITPTNGQQPQGTTGVTPTAPQQQQPDAGQIQQGQTGTQTPPQGTQQQGQTQGTNGQTQGTNGQQTQGTNGQQTQGTNGQQTQGTNGQQTQGTNGQTQGINGQQTARQGQTGQQSAPQGQASPVSSSTPKSQAGGAANGQRAGAANGQKAGAANGQRAGAAGAANQ